jgi:hypothetical protein
MRAVELWRNSSPSPTHLHGVKEQAKKIGESVIDIELDTGINAGGGLANSLLLF